MTIRRDKGFGYVDDKSGKTCMIRCFECGSENWAPAVASGDCAWCGYNPNKKQTPEGGNEDGK